MGSFFVCLCIISFFSMKVVSIKEKINKCNSTGSRSFMFFVYTTVFYWENCIWSLTLNVHQKFFL